MMVYIWGIMPKWPYYHSYFSGWWLSVIQPDIFHCPLKPIQSHLLNPYFLLSVDGQKSHVTEELECVAVFLQITGWFHSLMQVDISSRILPHCGGPYKPNAPWQSLGLWKVIGISVKVFLSWFVQKNLLEVSATESYIYIYIYMLFFLCLTR